VVMMCGTDTIREALGDQAEAFFGQGTIATIESVFQEYGEGCKGTMGWNGWWHLGKVSMRKEKGRGGTQSSLNFLCNPCLPYASRCDFCRRGTLEGPLTFLSGFHEGLQNG
jgi:hypothetical protein